MGLGVPFRAAFTDELTSAIQKQLATGLRLGIYELVPVQLEMEKAFSQ